MNDLEKSRVKQWIEGWKQTSLQLERLKLAELPTVSTPKSLLALADAYESCRLHFSPGPYSGLIEQQCWFKKYRAMKEHHD
jgi:hypothetical protein